MKPADMRRGSARLFTLVVLLVCGAVLGVAAANRQSIYDWVKLRSYTPPAEVAQLATDDTMTPLARHIYYVNHPAIDDKTTFAAACNSNAREQTIVLGCYHSDQAGIYVLGVSDPRLDGVEQVTAAHEMLHAAYDRLSSSERNKVDAMLEDYYQHDLHDQRILDTIAAYKKTEPHDVVNEMHSVFGTEVVSLPTGLEQYYQRYFTDRAQITGNAARYDAEFTSRQQAVAQDDIQLASMKAQISTDENDLKNRQTQIDSQRSQLLSARASNNIAAYNAGVPGFNGLIDVYNREVQTVQQLINQYNQLVTTRNAVALEEDQLVSDLSSSVAPIQQ